MIGQLSNHKVRAQLSEQLKTRAVTLIAKLFLTKQEQQQPLLGKIRAALEKVTKNCTIHSLTDQGCRSTCSTYQKTNWKNPAHLEKKHRKRRKMDQPQDCVILTKDSSARTNASLPGSMVDDPKVLLDYTAMGADAKVPYSTKDYTTEMEASLGSNPPAALESHTKKGKLLDNTSMEGTESSLHKAEEQLLDDAIMEASAHSGQLLNKEHHPSNSQERLVDYSVIETSLELLDFATEHLIESYRLKEFWDIDEKELREPSAWNAAYYISSTMDEEFGLHHNYSANFGAPHQMDLANSTFLCTPESHLWEDSCDKSELADDSVQYLGTDISLGNVLTPEVHDLNAPLSYLSEEPSSIDYGPEEVWISERDGKADVSVEYLGIHEAIIHPPSRNVFRETKRPRGSSRGNQPTAKKPRQCATIDIVEEDLICLD